MTRFVLAGLAVLLAACASAPAAPTGDDVPLVPFECRKRIDGQRATGWQTVRFEPAPRDATLTLRFDGDAPACSFTATWRFPQGLPAYAPLLHDGTRRCRGAFVSPFAVSCDLLTPSLDGRSQSIRSTLVTRTAGLLSQRDVVFDVYAPSAAVSPAPGPDCQQLPVATLGDVHAVLLLRDEAFREAQCTVLPAGAP